MKALVLPPNSQNISRAAALLQKGEVVGMPTETVYGLAGILFDEQALSKIFSSKERPTFDPLIAHVATQNFSDLENLGIIQSSSLSESAKETVSRLISTFWPGALTLVLPKTKKVPDLATSGLDTVAIRMPNHPVALELIRAAGAPLAAPSANRFGRISPTQAAHVVSELGDRIELILDGGPCSIGVESTVVRVDASGKVFMLRPGGVSVQDLERCLGARVEKETSSQLASPGMLESHYAPTKPLYLLESLPKKTARSVGFLAAQKADAQKIQQIEAKLGEKPSFVQILSARGNTEEAARNLFSFLRELDQSPVECLVAESWPSSEGLGHAINDRLQKASHPKL
ncbi:threonylcarbamoyl-AMP synthase [bacterium]|jgi:L-threonylcarbamoyladenylate synthase|nr:threonylcarbamoyl-AMP synthase [bacterium]